MADWRSLAKQTERQSQTDKHNNSGNLSWWWQINFRKI